MTEHPLKPETRAAFEKVSVATLATIMYRNGLRSQVIQDVRPLSRKGKNMVGPAFTLRYMPAREDRNKLVEFRNPQHPQRQAVEQCPPGHVMVMDSRQCAYAASAGDILVNRLQARDVVGVVTDGGFRDAMNIAELEIHSYHNRPASLTNLTTNEAIDINVPIGCGGAPVFPGDILVGDHDSVIVIPAHMAEDVAKEALSMTDYEDFVLEQVKQGATIIGLYPATDERNLEAFEEWKAQRGGGSDAP